MSPDVVRLKRRFEFLRVAAAKRRFVAPGLILQARPRRPGDTRVVGICEDAVRIGFTVSRKVGNAVARNRARRRLRAAVAQVMGDHARGGNDFVVIGRAATLRRPFGALVGDLETALRRLDAYDPKPGEDAGTSVR